MRAVVIADKQVQVGEAPDPICGSEELLIEVKAAGLNAADISQKNGLYPAPPGIPQEIPGLEIAGIVKEMGNQVAGFSIGDTVMGIVGGAAQAELCKIHFTNAVPVPKGMDLISAGGFCETYFTAYDALVRQANLQWSEKLLINGAAGGVGLSAIALGRTMNAQVIASARHSEHHENLRQLGAVPILPDDLKQFGPYDVILELVGAPNLQNDLTNLAMEGRISVIGIAAGARTEIDLRTLMSKRSRIFGSTLRARSTHAKALLVRELETHVLPLYGQGKLPVTIAATYPFSEVQRAYDKFARPGKMGKIILTF
ncbi:MAG: NAD(P)H-quinone oxidoreductase [Actinomycetota bacterium]|nr:MAG: NAD(P)H-quinone oxidoreductase [Actinomycetota bacterium]